MNQQLRIGTSGYQYDHWKDVLYPPDLPKGDWLGHFAEYFDTVEINNTFYNLPEASTFESWAEQVPAGFLFALKYSQYGTHTKKLKDPSTHLPNFVKRIKPLGDKLGPILVQLPPQFKANADRLDGFLDRAPDDHRWAVEFRDPDWFCDEIYAVLKAHDAAMCLHDMIPDQPRVITADWVYLRFHGAAYGGDYPHQVLTAAARQIAGWLDQGVEVFAYFNNDVHGYAVRDAQRLHRYVRNASTPDEPVAR